MPMPALSRISPRSLRIAAAIVFMLGPAAAVWNLTAASFVPKLQFKIGRQLSGVTEPPAPVTFGLWTIADGSWQKWISAVAIDAIPSRPALTRFSNHIRLKLFGSYGAPGIVAGERGHLIEQGYLTEYCGRNLDALAAKAAGWIPKLKELQDFYAARGHVFIYLITPSKAAHLPELFVHRLSCPSTERDRTEWLPLYTRMLREVGINVVDTATLAHSLKGNYQIDLFPVGGVHWNSIGAAHAANALIEEINRQGFRPPLPKLVWSYQLSEVARGIDRDLLDLINVLIPNPRYPTARVSYERAPCPPADREAAVATIGGSFTPTVAQVLLRNACLPGLRNYNYLYYGLRGGEAFRVLQHRLTREDILPLREADIVILEENESVFPGGNHATEFYRVILGK